MSTSENWSIKTINGNSYYHLRVSYNKLEKAVMDLSAISEENIASNVK